MNINNHFLRKVVGLPISLLQTPSGLCPWTPLGDFRPSDTLLMLPPPRKKFLATLLFYAHAIVTLSVCAPFKEDATKTSVSTENFPPDPIPLSAVCLLLTDVFLCG